MGDYTPHFFEHQDIRTPGRDAVGILYSLPGVFIFQIIPMRPENSEKIPGKSEAVEETGIF